MPLDLVIQGPALHEGHIETLRALARPSSVEAASGAARLRSVQSQDGVAAYCGQVGVDFAFVDASKRLADFRLLAMDMDSTLIAIECIDEIADMQGIKPQVAAITAAAMRGEIDFAESLRRRVALLAGLEEKALQRVYDERLRLSPGAERMLEALKRHGVKTLLVSGGFDFFTGRLKSRLGLDFTLSNTLELSGGKLTGRVQGRIVDAAVKTGRLRELMKEMGISREQVIALGDGANDLPMMMEAGVSIAYRAKPVVREKATYCFDYVGLNGIVEIFPP